MTRDQVLQEVARDPGYREICEKISKNEGKLTALVDDLYQEMMMRLCLTPSEKLVSLYTSGQLRYYFTRMTINAWRGSKTRASDFLRQHRDPLTVDTLEYTAALNTYTEESVTGIDELITEFESLNWFDTMIFQIYVLDKHTVESLAKEVNLSKQTVHSAILRVKRAMKKQKRNVW